MESITQILQSINSFSKQSFKFSQFIEPLLLLKKLPSDISYELNNDDFIFNLQQAFKHIDWLNDYFKNNINNLLIKEVSKLKNHKSKDTTIPYADFTVDKPPLFKKNLPVHLDFQSILNDSFNSGNPLKPVKRRNPDSFSFMGVCPFCALQKNISMTITAVKASSSAKPVKIPLLLKLLLQVHPGFTALTVILSLS